MAEFAAVSLFIAGLLVCIAVGANILFALVFGMFCFAGYALFKGHTAGETASMMKEGVAAYKNILTIFLLIGMLTAGWRASGTIPYIIYNAVGLIDPRYMALWAFLLCGLMSVLTGTSFGTAGTMGVICMMVSRSLGVSPVLAGGAILSGAFVGDRCSPMSSSAALVCALTGTDIYKNIANMVRTGALPLALSCLFYALAGAGASGQADVRQTVALFAVGFDLSAITVLPAAVIVLLLAARTDVKLAMLCSAAAACVISFAVQGMGAAEILETLVFGYTAAGGELGALINGGGMISMARVALIITISATYSGIFKHTGLLSGIKSLVKKWAGVITPFGATAVVSVFLSMISCNQTLSTSLTCQTAEHLFDDRYELAVTLENTSIVIAPLIPWSIAGAVPLQAVGATAEALPAAVYLYLIPICGWITAVIKSRRGAGKTL